MSDCVNCGRALQPAWKYCIYCGTRTTRTAAASIRTPVPAFVAVASTAQTPIDTVGAPAATATRSPRATRASAASIRDPQVDSAARVNPLAVLALILGVLASPLAALLGHVALGQLRESQERGVIAAWVAIVLGYLWLGFFLVLGVGYLATNG